MIIGFRECPPVAKHRETVLEGPGCWFDEVGQQVDLHAGVVDRELDARDELDGRSVAASRAAATPERVS